MAIITALIEIIIVLIIAGVGFWAIEQLLPLIPLPQPFMQVIRVLLVVLLVLIVLWVIVGLLGLFGGQGMARRADLKHRGAEFDCMPARIG
jgi:hypothetical protein